MSDCNKKISDLLLKCRVAKGIQQEELGKMIGVSRSTISAWEKGTRKPSIEKIHQLSKVLDVSFGFLLGNEDDRVCISKEEIQNLYGVYLVLDDFFMKHPMISDVGCEDCNLNIRVRCKRGALNECK